MTREQCLDLGNEILDLLEGKNFQVAVGALTGVLITVLRQTCSSEHDLAITGQEIGDRIARSWAQSSTHHHLN